MSPRPDVSKERREQILKAALTVFARSGFHQSRMDDIAQEAGLSKGSLYLYYQNKDAIIGALLQDFFGQELQRLNMFVMLEQERCVTERLLMLTEQLVAALKWMTEVMTITFEFYAIAGRQPEVHQFLRDYFQEYRALLAVLIQQGIERNEFRHVDVEATAMTFVAIYEGLALLFFVDPDATDWERQAMQSVKIVLDSLTQPVSESGI